MFGFGINKEEVAKLAGWITALQENFGQQIMLVAVEKGQIPEEFGDRNLAIIFGFANGGADILKLSDKVMMRALETYFTNSYRDGASRMLRFMKIFKDPSYASAAKAGLMSAYDVEKSRDLVAPMRMLAIKFLSDEF